MTSRHATHDSFTPGPWVADNGEGYSIWTIWSRMSPSGSGKPGPMVAKVVGDSAETDANATLIAAAPDLLAALEAIARDSEDELSRDCARAAIKKARGE